MNKVKEEKVSKKIEDINLTNDELKSFLYASFVSIHNELFKEKIGFFKEILLKKFIDDLIDDEGHEMYEMFMIKRKLERE